MYSLRSREPGAVTVLMRVLLPPFEDNAGLYIKVISKKEITRQLRELEADNLISRKVYPEVPPKVEYSMTEYGKTLTPVIYALQAWGLQHLEKMPEQT